MIPRSFRLALVVLLLSLSAIVLVFPFRSGSAQKNSRASASRSEGPPNYDAFGASRQRAAAVSAAAANALNQGQSQMEGGHAVQTESRLGVPTFVWASDNVRGQAKQVSSAQAQAKIDIESAARGHLGSNAGRYRLSTNDVAEARLAGIHNTGKGAIIAKFRQEVGGIEVFRDQINVIMNRNLQLIALSGYLTGDNIDSFSSDFKLQPADAIAKAIADLTGTPFDASALQGVKSDASEANAASGADSNPYLRFTARSNAGQGFTLGDEPARVKKIVYHLVDSYVPAYYVESNVLVPPTNLLTISSEAFPTELAYSYVISAVDGEILFRNNLVDDAGTPYTYRVWADPVTKIPYDTPAGNGVHPKVVAVPDGAQSPFVPMSDVTLANYPYSQNDPWLPPSATETVGNNVDAFVNLFSPDGYGNPTTTTPTDPPTGDFRAQITAADAFLHTHTPDGNHGTAEARQGSIQQLFYNLNFLHDWFYDAGFNEAAGNAQNDNYGRGGLAADSIKGQVQDFQSFNNANMLTPADGGRPRMRMYTFTSPANHLDIQAPSSIAGKKSIGISQTGTQAWDVTAEIVKATFTSGPTTCTITNAAALAGKIGLFDFDNTDGTGCGFSTRISRIHATGAVAALMAYTSAAPTLVANITGQNAGHTKPVGVISWNSSTPIKNELAVPNTVTARMFRTDRDGTVDNQIVFHEWGHYISNRLIGNANGLNTNYSGGLGEGWGDFTAMMLTVRPDDTSTPSNTTWNGAYALATYATSGVPFSGAANQGYYFGIRRYPYSTDLNIDPLTFKHIQDGTALPVGPPVAFGASGASNSEVHNTGEVWTTMLWESYAALLRDTQGSSPRLTFAEAQDRMKNYLVAGYKMTPNSPTLLEARDAVLAAAFAYDYNDGRLIAQAFAKRGAGVGAVSPDRFSGNNVGVTESFASDSGLTFIDALLDDSVSACDFDGYLDKNEKGKLTVTIRNSGSVNLFNTTATVSSSNSAVTFPDGNTITFPASQPLQNVSANVVVQATGLVGIETTDFTITIQDSGAPPVGPVVGHDVEYLNVDEIPASSATDTVEPRQTQWTTSSNATLGVVSPWRRIKVGPGPNHLWFVPDPGQTSDEYLNSPVMTVDGSGSLNLQFNHSWSFEFDGAGNYDGGVVEMSVNGGAYTDIGTSAYNGTILNSGPNPLKGRPAFVKNSSGNVHTSLTQAIAPGSTVQIRFRFGSDGALGAPGWQVDDIAFVGVVETPFATPVSDGDVCNAPGPPLVTIVLTPNTLPAGSVGTPYSGVLTASGGTGPYTYSVTPAVLPPGLVTNVVSGSLEFSGTPTKAGSYLINVKATDSASHQGNANYTININKGTPTITWSNPADIVFGTALSSTQLNGTASVPGVLTYTPAAGVVLNAGNGQTLSVNFVPTDTANYNNASKNVTINVLKATPSITWANPADITYGTALSGTQLNATTSVAGTFTYTPAAGVVLNAGNGQTLSVDFVPTDTANYNNASKNVLINVLKATPTITWSNPADITYGTALSSTQLNATASVPGVLTYTPGAGVVLNAGNTQTLTANFVPTDTANYSNASKNVSINVLKATTTTGVSSSVNPSDLGQVVTFTATVASGAGIPTGTVQFKSDGSNIGGPQALNGSGIATVATSALTAATHTITADYSGDGNFVLSDGTLAGGQVVRSKPSLSINDVSITEGDSGTKSANFTVTLSSASNLTVTVDFATANGTATAGDYQSTSGTVTFNPTQTAQTISVTLNGDTTFESDDTFFVNLSNGVNATISDNQGLGTILNDDAQGGIFSFSQANYSVGESGSLVTIAVSRSGDLTGSATVDYATADDSAAFSTIPCSTVNGNASSRCDYTATAGTLSFAASETSKTFTILISQDSFVEGAETFPITLLNPTGGAVFGTPSTATVTIADDATEPSSNPIDDTETFVRAHYHDFLNREADSAGLAFWVDVINKCNDPARRPAGQTAAQCIANERVNVSAAFFLSIEFQQTGYLVYRFNGASFGDIPGTPVPVTFNEFMADTQEIARGVVVGQTGWEAVLESHKQAFALNFVQRPNFTSAYPSSLTPAHFVDGLFTNTGVTPSSADRTAAINEFGSATTTADVNARARALRRVADNSLVVQQHFNRAFVLMEYFGYLRRNPDAAPEPTLDFQGYNFWLGKLNQFNGNFISAEMVKAFITSAEYRNRFGN